MKNKAKIIFYFVLYVLMCLGILTLAARESIPQPIGLLLVAMVMTPVVVSVCGGLPVDFMKPKIDKV